MSKPRQIIASFIEFISPLDKLVELPRQVKQVLMLGVDLIFLPLAIWLSVTVWGGSAAFSESASAWLACLITITASAAVFLRLGLYRAVIRFMGQQAILAIIRAVTLSSVIFAVAQFLTNAPLPSATPFLYWFFALFLIGGSRLLVRAFYQKKLKRQCDNVVIYGAGASGRQLLTALMHGAEFHPVFFVDDDVSLHGSVINGVPIESPSMLPRIIKEYDISQVLLAMPSVAREYRREVIDKLVGLPVYVRTIPNFSSLLQGTAAITEIQDIEIEDLLGRDPVPPHPEMIDRCVAGKVVLVTGAGGSIGSELCRQLISHQPRELVLLDSSEYALYSIERELRNTLQKSELAINIVPLLGSVQDRSRVQAVMQSFAVQTVYHAAAYKHVPLVEFNIVEGVRNNVFGTVNTALAAMEAGVSKFVLISTDKAVRPTNIMGASKRLAEIVLQGLAESSDTEFSMVRFGNVLGSSGSVVPLFRDQIMNGGPVTVTHTEIIRYFMTIPEAAQLVLQAGAMASGGDVFVLDMGEPVRILDLAKRLIRLMGYEVKDDNNPFGDIEIHVTGLRPGEKLYEELLLGDNVTGTGHPMIMRAEEEYPSTAVVDQFLVTLEAACDDYDCESIRAILLELVSGFKTKGHIADHLWQRQGREQDAAGVTGADNVAPLFPEKKHEI